jgi:drug/metabolite transporter (DMT)-like permease
VVAKKYTSRINPAVNTLVQSIVGSATLCFVGVMTELGAAIDFTSTAIVAVLYLGVIGSALAFVGWYWLFTKTTATNSSLILLITPIVALLLGWLILQEVPEPIVAFGTVLILSGVWVTVKQGDEMMV